MSSDPSDRAAIEREIRSRQEHLATTVDELAGRVAPKALAQSAAAGARSRLSRLVGTAKDKVQGLTSGSGGQHGSAPEGRPEHDGQGPGRGRAAIGSVRTTVAPAVVDQDGALRVARLTAVGSAVLALVGALLWRRGSRSPGE